MHMSKELCFIPANELATQIRHGELSPVTVVDAYLERITDWNNELNAYITLIEEEARDRARKAERAVERGDDLGPLHGVPIAVKDFNAYKAGVRHTFGLKPFEDWIPDFSAPIVERLEDAGGIILGKTNTPALGHKGMTDNKITGATPTPFNLEKTAGGSSGGSAAAVAAGLTALGEGSDIGGSIRIPASACGVYGLKPSWGRVPFGEPNDAFIRHSPFFELGPITRTVKDAALMLSVMAGPHPQDPLSIPDDGTDYVDATTRSIDGWEIAYSPGLGSFPIDPAVTTVIEEALTAFETAGASVTRTDPEFQHSQEDLADSLITAVELWQGEIALNFKECWDIDLLGDHRDEVEDELIETMESGQQLSGMEFRRSNRVRTDAFHSLEALFEDYDLLITPTLAVPPFDKESKPPDTVADTEIRPFEGWFLTWPFNMTGHPAASIPAGFTDDRLPVGMQIVGPRFADGDVLAASARFEEIRPWADSYQRIN